MLLKLSLRSSRPLENRQLLVLIFKDDGFYFGPASLDNIEPIRGSVEELALVMIST